MVNIQWQLLILRDAKCFLVMVRIESCSIGSPEKLVLKDFAKPHWKPIPLMSYQQQAHGSPFPNISKIHATGSSTLVSATGWCRSPILPAPIFPLAGLQIFAWQKLPQPTAAHCLPVPSAMLRGPPSAKLVYQGKWLINQHIIREAQLVQSMGCWL